MVRKIVGVVCDAECDKYRKLFLALSSLFPVEFRETERDCYAALDALVLFDRSRLAGIKAAAAGIRSLVFLNTGEKPVHFTTSSVSFASPPNLHAYFHNQTLIDEDVKELVPLTPLPGEKPVASKAGNVFWIYRPEARSAVDFLTMAPPELADDQYLCHYLQAGQFLRLLPLFHFLREVTRDIAWEAPPLRANLMIDDPNLHSLSYGYINYRDLVQHAKTHNYHVSLATIPLDAWHVHSKTASIFRENPSHVSLLVHGNNHSCRELATCPSDASKIELLAQALRRIERLEKKSGLEVSRVMAAPHSACTGDMLNFMLQLGYEAACIPWDSLFRFNPHDSWNPAIGLDMVDFQGGGLPIMTRVRLRPDLNPQLRFYPDWKTGIILSAFLSQPVILLGHHEDAWGGMKLLAQVAETINRLGRVKWMDMKGILRSNYMTRSEGKHLRVRMCARRIAVYVPEGIEEMSVERPWIGEDGETEMLLIKQVPKGTLKLAAGKASEVISVQQNETVEIIAVPKTILNYSELPSPPCDLWPLARRLLTECRDRVLPILFGRKPGLPDV
ncbi:MAG: hypothetical protein ACLP3B_10600 [Syntrophobacteraceae bacterium]